MNKAYKQYEKIIKKIDDQTKEEFDFNFLDIMKHIFKKKKDIVICEFIINELCKELNDIHERGF